MLFDKLFDKEMDQDEFEFIVWEIIENLEETCTGYACKYDLEFDGLKDYVN